MQSPQQQAPLFEFHCRARSRESLDPTPPPELRRAVSDWRRHVAANTPCGIREENGRLKMVGTTRGDGTVTWDSGRIGGIGAFYYLPAKHGDLLATSECFPGLIDLLVTGTTSQLSTVPPVVLR